MNTKATSATLQLVALCLILGCSSGQSFKDASELENHLNGKWNVVSSVYDGTKIPDAKASDGRLDFANGKVRLIGSAIDEPLDCTLDVSTTPHRITMRAETGAPLLQGILEVNGDDLRLCYRMHAKRDLGFPEKYESTSGSGLMLINAEKGEN